MWLGLIHVTSSISTKTPKASIVDIQTGDKYGFVDGEFQLSSDKVLTQEEEMILRWMANDWTTDAICLELGINENKFNHKKKKIYNQLGVQGMGGAIHKANAMGII
jgi:DNA-binding CsgD family transcriptional regulator